MPEHAHREGDEQRTQRRQKAALSKAKQLKPQEESPEASAEVSPLEGYAAILSDKRFSHPANAGQKAQVASQLQQSHGNAYVQRLLDSRAVQAKLTVNPPDDQYEREANKVADAVARAPDTHVQRQPLEEEEESLQTKSDSSSPVAIQRQPIEEEEEELLQAKPDGSTPVAIQRQPLEEEEEEEALQTKPDGSSPVAIQRQPLEEEEEEEALQTKPDGSSPVAVQRQPIEEEEEEEALQTKPDGTELPRVSKTLERRIDAVRGSGEPLGDSVRAPLESQLGRDLSQVHIHSDHEADSLSREVQARAFTSGSDIFFRQGAYDAHSQEGKSLLGHEVTHVVQQGAAGPNNPQPANRSAPVHASPVRKTAGIQRQGAMAEEEERPSWLSKGEPPVVASRRGINKPLAVVQLTAVDNRARVNAESFATEVGRACDHFETYAKPKIAALENEFTAGDLVNALLDAAMIPIGSPVAGIASKVGKQLAGKFADMVKSTMQDTVKKALSNESDVASLKTAVEKATAGAKDAATKLKVTVGQNLTPIISATQDRLNSDKPLTKAQDEMLGMFYGAPVPNIDDYLERFYGIPSKATAKTVQVQVYYHLVRRFEEKLIEAEMPMDFEERLRKRALKGHIASQRALKAAEERRKALEGE